MGQYLSRSDVEAVFGIDNVVAWSNLDNTQAGANEGRIDTAIAYAEAAIDDRFRGGRYRVPIVCSSGGTPKVVVGWAAKLAGIWLYESRGLRDGDEMGNKLSALKQRVEAEISMYLSGQRRLAAELSGDAPNAPAVVLE